MRGHLLIYNEIDFTKYGVVESVQYTDLDKEIIYDEIPESTPIFRKFKNDVKVLDIDFTIITKTKDYRKNEVEGETFISKVFSKTPQLLRLNNKYCMAIISRATKKVFGNSIHFSITMINLNGLWYGEEKTSNLSNSFDVVSFEDSTFAKIKLMPTSTAAKIILNDKFIAMKNLLANREVVIDLSFRTIKQLGDHVEIEIGSDFPTIRHGINNISSINCSGTLTYREVISL